MPDLPRLYLDTVKALILNDVYPEAEAERAYLIKCVEGVERFDARAFYSGAVGDPETMRAIDAAHRTGRHHEGRLKFATIGASMIGRARLENVEAFWANQLQAFKEHAEQKGKKKSSRKTLK